MDWQVVGALAAVALAGAYVVWQGWRTWRGTKAGCGGGCGCAKSMTQTNVAIIAPESLVLRQKTDGPST